MVSAVVESSLKSLIQNQTWDDLTPGLPAELQGKLTGMVVFKTVSDLIIQYVEPHPALGPLLTHRVGYSTVSRQRSRDTLNSTNLSDTLLNGLTYGRPVSYLTPRRSRILLHPIQ